MPISFPVKIQIFFVNSKSNTAKPTHIHLGAMDANYVELGPRRASGQDAARIFPVPDRPAQVLDEPKHQGRPGKVIGDTPGMPCSQYFHTCRITKRYFSGKESYCTRNTIGSEEGEEEGQTGSQSRSQRKWHPPSSHGNFFCLQPLKIQLTHGNRTETMQSTARTRSAINSARSI